MQSMSSCDDLEFLTYLTARDLNTPNRPQSVSEWCARKKIPEPNKADVAQILLDSRRVRPLTVEPRAAGVKLHAAILRALEIEVAPPIVKTGGGQTERPPRSTRSTIKTATRSVKEG